VEVLAIELEQLGELPQVVLVGEEPHDVLAVAAPDQLQESLLGERPKGVEDLGPVPEEGFEQCAAQIEAQRDAQRPVKLQDPHVAGVGLRAPDERVDPLAVLISVRDEVLVRVMDERKRG
jgi:hypothetical protein